MAAPNLVLEDIADNGWEMHLNYQEWDTEVLLDWVSRLDENEDFRDQYENLFTLHNITGVDFTRTKLGNEQWCRENLNMITSNHAKQFSDIVRHRITQYENSQRPNPPLQPVVSLDDVELSPHAKNQLNPDPPQQNVLNNHDNRPWRDDQHRARNNNNITTPPIRPQPNNASLQQYEHQNGNIDEKHPKPAYDVTYIENPTAGGKGGGGGTQIIGESQQESYVDSLNNVPAQIQRSASIEEAQRAVNRAMSLPPKSPVKASGSYGSQSYNQAIHNASIFRPQEEDLSQPPPDLPFISHKKPSMRSMSNKFRQKGPNVIMYPPKNGPIPTAKRLGIPIDELPPYDPHDEICGDAKFTQDIILKYAEELNLLKGMGLTDHNRSLRLLLKYKDSHSSDLVAHIIDEYLQPQMYEGIYIGDRVVRGPDWKWGDQDGGRGLEGTVRGLRQWHPQDPPTVRTEAVVLWDHGLYGNYRFGYKSAFDLKVMDRMSDEKDADSLLSVGERVCRKQRNWRWGQQDGGAYCPGRIVELYASPAPFEGGCRVGVLWDHAHQQWREKAEGYLAAHPIGDDEWYNEDEDKNDIHDNTNVLTQFKEWKHNPHQVRKKRKKYIERKIKSIDYDSEEEHSSEWDEPDFDEILCKPIAKYRWQLEDKKSAYGVASDLEIVEKKDVAERRYLMIDDRVRKSLYFSARRKEPKSEHGIVLKVEQWDPRRVHPNEIKGDKVYTTWSSHQSYRFECDNGNDDIVFHKRGQVFEHQYSRIKVGDRVRRGVTWRNEYGMEDGGHERKGTVVCVQYVLQCAGILAKVRWDRTGHLNFYSWGFKDIYDLKKAAHGIK